MARRNHGDSSGSIGRAEMRALGITDAIYAAAIDTSRWQVVVDELSHALGGQCVGFHLQLPTKKTRPVWYGCGFQDAYAEVFARQLRAGLPWEPARTSYWLEGFRSSSPTANRDDLLRSSIYSEWFEPQQFEPEPPVGFTVATDAGRALAGVVILHPRGRRWLDAADFDFLETLVPHLRRAYEIHTRLHEAHALAEALDRMPTGLVLLNQHGRIVLTNRTARAISDQNDGFELKEGTPRLYRRGDQDLMDRILEQATHPDETSRRGGGVMAVTRRSGRRPFNVLIAPLLDAQQDSTLQDASAALYISDLERGSTHRSEALRTLYGLTQAEAELVDLLCEGLSLDEAAARRGVTTNTARSQLKQVFSKTSTSRQSELVRLVLAGLPPAIE